MKTKFTALELILHLTEGSTTPNTLQHIQKIARSTIEALKEQEELQPFKDMTDESYLRGVKDGKQSPQQRTWVGLTLADKEEYLALDFGGNRLDAMDWAARRLKEKNT